MGVQINGDTGNVIATKGTFSGDVGIGGTLTYEDVTNVDSVGLITARQGIKIGSGVGVAASISVDGNAEFAGIVTATTFKGDGSNLTGIDADKISEGNTEAEVVDTGSDGHFKVTTEGTERLRVDPSGRLLLGKTSGSFALDVQTGSDSTVRITNSAETGLGSHDAKIVAGGTYYQNPNIVGSNIKFTTFNGSSEGERFRIGDVGQLGIGGANYGTSGQVLTSQGNSSAVQWATPSGWVFGTAGDYDTWTSVTDVALSGWPSTWKQIRINFTDISSNANAYIQYFVSKSSTAGQHIASGYQTQSGYYGAATSVDSVTNMGRFSGTGSSGYSMTGYVNFHKFNGTIIRYEGQLSEDGNTYIFVTNGHVTCDPTTDMTHIFFRCQGYSYDAGTFSIDYLV